MFSNSSNGTRVVLQILVVLAIIVAAVMILLSMGVTKGHSQNHQVQFQVEASGGFAIITLSAGSQSINNPTTVTVPWSKVLTLNSGTAVYLTAANPTQTGKLTCTIVLDGTNWKAETTEAPKDGVACAGIVP